MRQEEEEEEEEPARLTETSEWAPLAHSASARLRNSARVSNRLKLGSLREVRWSGAGGVRASARGERFPIGAASQLPHWAAAPTEGEAEF